MRMKVPFREPVSVRKTLGLSEAASRRAWRPEMKRSVGKLRWFPSRPIVRPPPRAEVIRPSPPAREQLRDAKGAVRARAAVVVGTLGIRGSAGERSSVEPEQLFPDEEEIAVVERDRRLDPQEDAVGAAEILDDEAAVLCGKKGVFGAQEEIFGEANVADRAADSVGRAAEVIGDAVAALTLDHDQTRDDDLLL
jgi:hypothetical protein